MAPPPVSAATGWQRGFWSLMATQFQNAFSDNALKQLIKTQKIPPFDVFLTQKTRFWHRSTLVKAGLMRDSQQVATNQQ
jgi:hypothetical protein